VPGRWNEHPHSSLATLQDYYTLNTPLTQAQVMYDHECLMDISLPNAATDTMQVQNACIVLLT